MIVLQVKEMAVILGIILLFFTGYAQYSVMPKNNASVMTGGVLFIDENGNQWRVLDRFAQDVLLLQGVQSNCDLLAIVDLNRRQIKTKRWILKGGNFKVLQNMIVALHPLKNNQIICLLSRVENGWSFVDENLFSLYENEINKANDFEDGVIFQHKDNTDNIWIVSLMGGVFSQVYKLPKKSLPVIYNNGVILLQAQTFWGRGVNSILDLSTQKKHVLSEFYEVLIPGRKKSVVRKKETKEIGFYDLAAKTFYPHKIEYVTQIEGIGVIKKDKMGWDVYDSNWGWILSESRECNFSVINISPCKILCIEGIDWVKVYNLTYGWEVVGRKFYTPPFAGFFFVEKDDFSRIVVDGVTNEIMTNFLPNKE